MSEIYIQGGKVLSKCSRCGDTSKHYQKKNTTRTKPYYFSMFEKVNWFRGDDVYLGMICKKCWADTTPPNPTQGE